MKKIDINSAEGLEKIKDSMNLFFESKINEAKVLSSMNSFNRLDLSSLNMIFEAVSVKLYDTKNGKSLIKKYVKCINEDKNLKAVYRLFNTIKKCDGVKDASLFLNEAIGFKKEIDKKGYRKSIGKLSEIVKECVKEAELDGDTLNGVIDSAKNSINESIDYIILNEKKLSNLNEYIENYNKVQEHIKESVDKRKPCDNGEKPDIKSLMNDLDEIFESENWESEAVYDLAYYEMSGKDGRELFENYKNSCIELIEEGINGSENEKAARLSEMKSKLSNKNYNAESLYEDVYMLAELKETLKN